MISNAKKPERWISKGYRFSPNKSTVVHEKTKTPRSCLRWKPTGRNFKTVALRWVPTGKLFTSSTTKVDSEPPHGSNADISKPHECIHTLNFDTCTSYNVKKDNLRVWLLKRLMSKNKPLPSVVSLVTPAPALIPIDTTGTPSSTTIVQDVPSASTSPTTKETQALVIHQGVEEQMQGNPNAQFDNDPFINIFTPDLSSEESSRDVIPSNLHQINQPFNHLNKWKKDHLLDNVIGNPS
ncbi:hypothetical protein Tco_0781402 [Tanacetum coccineum]